MNLSALQHSPLLQSLGWAIVNSLWQAAFLWIVAQIILLFYKNASAQIRSHLSTGILLFIFTWFTYTFFDKYFSLNSISAIPTSAHVNVAALSSFTWAGPVEKAIITLPFLSLSYLLLLPFLTVRLILAYRNLHFIRHHGLQKPPAAWKIFMQAAALQIGIQKKIILWLSEHVDVPATVGFLKPIILLPLAAVNNLTTEQLEAIILHELSHIRRNDYLLNILIVSIETLLFFNPFVVLITRTIKKERENCCDDLVLQYQYDRHEYASALLSLEVKRHRNLKLSVAATSGKKQLLVRVQRIMEGKTHGDINYSQKIIALVLITAILCSIQWISISGRTNNKKDIQQAHNNITKPKQIVSNEKVLIIENIRQNERAPVKVPTRYQTVIDNSFAGSEMIKDPAVRDMVIVNTKEDLPKENKVWPEGLEFMLDSLEKNQFDPNGIMLNLKKLQYSNEKRKGFNVELFRKFRTPVPNGILPHVKTMVRDSANFYRQHDQQFFYDLPNEKDFVFNFEGLPKIDSLIKNAFRRSHTKQEGKSMIKIIRSNGAMNLKLNMMDVDIRDGVVYLKGNAMSRYIPNPLSVKAGKHFIMKSDDNKNVEIDLKSED